MTVLVPCSHAPATASKHKFGVAFLRVKPFTKSASRSAPRPVASTEHREESGVSLVSPSSLTVPRRDVLKAPGSDSITEHISVPAPPPTGLRKVVLANVFAAAVTLGIFTTGGVVGAAELGKVGVCLLSQCQGALAGCLGDVTCATNLVCLNSCNGRPDEIACQLRCGDLYSDTAIDAFNSCALSQKQCVPQQPDEGAYPVPAASSLDPKFDLAMLTGRWYITAGLNPLFDTFDCQVHFFGTPEPGKMFAKITWRISKPDNDFIERETLQRFVQDEQLPGVLYNHDNQYLHYQDDWYVLASRPDNYFLVYYRGTNDAWKGYGGAVLYTRSSTVPESIIPEVRSALQGVGLNWEDFRVTDNTCPPHPPKKSLVEDVEELEELTAQKARLLEATLEADLRSFGRGFTVVEKKLEEELARELTAEEQLVERELREAASFLQNIEESYVVNPLLRWLPFFKR